MYSGFNGIFRIRNEQELQAGVLELTPILMEDRRGKKIKPNGNPRYIVSMNDFCFYHQKFHLIFPCCYVANR